MASDEELEKVLQAFSSLNNELVNQKRELERMRIRLEKALRERQLAISSVAHDLRTPISALMGFLDLLRMTSDPVQRETFYRNMDSSLSYLNNLVSSMTDFAHVEGGKLSLKMESLDLGEVALRAIEHIRSAARAKGVDVECSVGEQSLQCMADSLQLERVVANIVSNAIRFSPPQSTVRVLLSSDQNWVQLQCCDNGPGIPSHMLNSVFEPFFRAPNQGGGGLGLGLAIVEEVVRRHGGTVEASNSAGGGAVFSLKIPRCGNNL